MDPILDTVVTFVQTVIENPVLGPMLVGAVRTATGYVQTKWKEKSGRDFDKKEFGATLIKYEIAINALAALIPGDYKYASAIVLVADVLGSWGKKLLGV